MKQLVTGLLLTLMVVAAAAAWGVGRLRGVMARQASAALGCPVTIGAVYWAPPLGISAAAVSAESPGGSPWLTVRELTVRVAPWSLLWQRAVVLDIAASQPELLIEQRPDGTTNLPLAPRSSSGAPAAGGTPAQAPSMVPSQILIRDGLIVYRDRREAAAGVECRLGELQVTMRQALPALAYRYQARGVVQDGAGRTVGSLEADGHTTLAGETTATVTVVHRALEQLAPYVRQAIGTELTAGELTLVGKVLGQPDRGSVHLRLILQRLAFRPGALTIVGLPAQQLVFLLQDETGRITLNIPLAGRWEELRVSWGPLLVSAIQQALQSAVARTAQRTLLEGLNRLGRPPAEGGEAESVEDQVKAIGDQLKGLFKK